MPDTARHPGRRPAADTKVIKKHEKLISDAVAERKAAEDALQVALDKIAKRSDEAMQANVQTQHVAELLGVTRQAVYKLVQERVYGKERKPSTNGSKPTQKKTAAPAKTKVTPTNNGVKPRSAPPKFKSPRKRKESTTT